MHPNLRRGHEALWERFFDARTNLIYDTPFHEPSDLPTPEEVAASHPSCAGWGTGMEDCALTGGFVLDGLVTAYRVSGEALWAERARLVFRGLAALGTVSGQPGFVARGFAPGRRDVYPNSSADQYTAFVFGVWNYARSAIATDAERAAATRLLVEIAAFVEAHGHDIPRRDGRPSIYGDTSSLDPGRACRILQFYRAAADLSGDAHWQDRYRELVEDQDRIRLRRHYGPEEWDPRRNVHCVNQSQAAFRLLYDAEDDAELRAAWRAALRAEALSVIGRIALWREKLAQPAADALPPNWRPRFQRFLREHPDYDPADPAHVQQWHGWRREPDPALAPTAAMRARAAPAIPWLRHQVESLGVVMLCDEPDLKQRVAADAWRMLTEGNWAHVAQAGVWECLDLSYWRGVEAGVFPQER